MTTEPPLSSLVAVDALDRMPAEPFASYAALLFEGAAAFLDRLAAARPFGSTEALFAAARAIAMSG